MTERPSTLATTLRVAALSGAAALAIWGGLSLQLAAGDDPALGPKKAAANTPAAPEKRVMTTVVKRMPKPTPTETPAQPPATTTTPTAPAPTPTVAPAPAPAPVQTSTS